MKMIVLEVPMGKDKMRLPIMFPNILVHANVAEALLGMKHMEGAKVVSAGEFSSMDLREVHFHGESTSLKVKADPIDNEHLAMSDYNAGFYGPQV